MRLDKASGLNEKTTGTLRTLYCHPSQTYCWTSTHKSWGGSLSGGAFSCASPMPTVPMGAIGGDKPAWMGAIELNHFGPVLTHNPPRPSRVMDVGWWQEGGGRQWGRLQVCVWMASGFLLSCPPLLAHNCFADYSVCQSVCSCPDTTLTLTPFSFCVCAVCHRTVLIMWVQASSTVFCVYNVLTI